MYKNSNNNNDDDDIGVGGGWLVDFGRTSKRDKRQNSNHKLGGDFETRWDVKRWEKHND